MAMPLRLPCQATCRQQIRPVAAQFAVQPPSTGRHQTVGHKSPSLSSQQQPPPQQLSSAAIATRSVSCRDSLSSGASVQPLQPPEQQTTFDVSVPDGAPIRVYGVRHLEAEYAAAEWIWQSKPSLVVVETALTAQHGAATGSMLSMTDHEQRATDFRFRMLSQIAAQLDTAQSPADSTVWQQVKMQFPSEQLVYIAALAVGAQLVFGDRPKEATYSRLAGLPSIVDLDFAFGSMSVSNYQETLSRHQQQLQDRGDGELNGMNCISIVMTHERDCILAHSLREAAIAAGPSAYVVGVVGEGHLPGIYTAFAEEQWLNPLELQLLQKGAEPPQRSSLDAAVHRALLTACLGLCCPVEVLDDFDRWLGPVPADQQEAYQLSLEVYGSTRMLLATLSQADLSAVCGSWDCDMWQVLAPLRAVRPLNSGPGYDEQLVLELRQLYLEINLDS